MTSKKLVHGLLRDLIVFRSGSNKLTGEIREKNIYISAKLSLVGDFFCLHDFKIA